MSKDVKCGHHRKTKPILMELLKVADENKRDASSLVSVVGEIGVKRLHGEEIKELPVYTNKIIERVLQ